MRKSHKYLIVLTILPLLFQSAIAKPGGGHKGMMGLGIIQQLDLSAEQKQQIKTVMQQHKQQVQAEREQNKALRQARATERLALLKAADFNESQAKAMISSHQAQKMDKKLKALQVQHQVYQLLSPEQQAQYDALFLERAAKMPQKGGKGKGKGKGNKAQGKSQGW